MVLHVAALRFRLDVDLSILETARCGQSAVWNHLMSSDG
jgi:hypothetical protein